MESKWYFFPGQTVENTKISDRAHALHLSQSAWHGITRHLDRKKRIQEALDKEEAHKRALKEGSQAMTKQWPDSIENQRLRKENEREQRNKKDTDAKIKNFYKMRAEQEEIRKKYVEKVKKDLFLSSGYPKQLTSALLMSETLYEREKQIEFDNMLKKHEEEVAKEMADKVREEAERDKREDEEKRQKVFQEKIKIRDILKEQVLKRELEGKEALRVKAEKEEIDRINAEKEEAFLKQCEFDMKLRKRREMAEEKRKELAEEKLKRETTLKEEKEMEEACEIYAEVKNRIECMKKTKLREMHEADLKRREEIARKVAHIKESKDKEENERIAAVQAQKEKEEIAKMLLKKQKLAYEKQQRTEDRREYLERKQREKETEDELKKWEMLNRCKTDDVIKEHNKEHMRKNWEKIMAYRRDLLEQMAEEKEESDKEKQINELWVQEMLKPGKMQDQMFFEYANEVLELAKKKQRPTYPIERVIQVRITNKEKE